MNYVKSQHPASVELDKTMEELNLLFKNIVKNIMTSKVILEDIRGERKSLRR